MESEFERQIKKGVLKMIVLGLICKKPNYGYELLSLLDQQSNGLLAMKEGTLYPILYRLEDEGLIKSQWKTNDEGAAKSRSAPKKVYSATEKGLSTLKEQREVWRRFSKCIDSFCEEESK